MKIVWLWPNQFRFLRESTISVYTRDRDFLSDRHKLAGEATSTIAYEVSDDGRTTRCWWVFQPVYDGIEPDPRDCKECPTYTLVEPILEPGKPSPAWKGIAASLRHPRLDKPPIKLERRWADWQYRHRERVTLPPGRLKLAWRWLVLRTQRAWRWTVDRCRSIRRLFSRRSR